MNPDRVLVRAAFIVDARGVLASPGAALVEDGRILAAGTPQAVGAVPDAKLLDRPGAAVIPALVNAHAHLDLSHIGLVKYGGSFIEWIKEVRARRAMTEQAIAESMERGIALSRRGGTAIVGDIAGVSSSVPMRLLREQGLAGISFMEVFGLGARHGLAIEAIRRAVDRGPARQSGVALGIQPHAPYSCAAAVFEFAADTGLPVSTHLAETTDEIEFTKRAAGPFAAMLKEFGVWDDSIAGSGLHPVEHLASALARSRWLAAHGNYLEPRHIPLLRSVGASVAYCPRASAYFGHPERGLPPHPYRELHAAGVNVALGTDSLLCLDTPDRISVLDEVRFLHRRDGTDASALLAMATVNGAKALGFQESLVSLRPGLTAGLLAVELGPGSRSDLEGMMKSASPPEWVAGPFTPSDEWFERDAAS